MKSLKHGYHGVKSFISTVLDTGLENALLSLRLTTHHLLMNSLMTFAKAPIHSFSIGEKLFTRLSNLRDVEFGSAAIFYTI